MKKIPALLLTLALLFSIGMALAQDGAATPEEAVEKYYQAILNLDANAAIPYTQWSDQVSEAYLSHFDSMGKEDKLLMLQYNLHVEEGNYSDQEMLEMFKEALLREAECMRRVLENQKAGGRQYVKVSAESVTMSAQKTSDPELEAAFREMLETWIQPGIEIQIVKLFMSADGNSGDTTETTFCYNGRWYVCDKCNWHYYVD